MINITPIANAVIALMSAIITVMLIPWIKRKASAEQFAEIRKWVKVAVEAAEKIYAEAGLGEKKKAYVENFLEAKGYELETDTIDALIEAAVLELTQAAEKTPSPSAEE